MASLDIKVSFKKTFYLYILNICIFFGFKRLIKLLKNKELYHILLNGKKTKCHGITLNKIMPNIDELC